MRPAATIRCPRCGYELQGVVAAWSDTCPLEGACTECGLDFEWAEIVSPGRFPAWCVEYARGWRSVPRCFVMTALMMLRPWRFWSELKMTHAPRWGRVFAMFALVGVVLYAGFALTVGALVLVDAGRTPVPFAQAAFSAVYATLLPLSRDPVGPYAPGMRPPVRYASAFFPHVSSLDSVRFVVLTGSAPGNWIWRPNFGPALFVAAVGSATIFTAPLGFLALPASRRRAKVMWWHVFRITLYSLLIVAAVSAAVFVRFTLGHSHWRVLRPVAFSQIWYAVLWGVPIVLLTWWYFAIHRYLRMPHALGVAVALVVIGMLLGPALLILVLSATF